MNYYNEFDPDAAQWLSRDMVRGQPELGRLARRARSNRRIRLKGYGNAIDPRIAAEFVKVALSI